MNAKTSSPPSVTPSKRQRGTLGHLVVVITAAFMTATLFTAWTPAGLFPDSLAENLNNILAPQADETAVAAFPSATARPHLRIGIVSGHWGNDSGAVCPDGLREADLNQEVATRVKESLVGQGFEVDLLKEFDPRLDNYQAMLLVSIHADSCQFVNNEATGFKVSAAMSTMYPEKAARLTACLRQRYTDSTGLSFHTGSVTVDMTSYHAFDEIHPDTTAAIIETGFMNLDRQVLTEKPDRVAAGITNGILCYVRNENISPAVTPEP